MGLEIQSPTQKEILKVKIKVQNKKWHETASGERDGKYLLFVHQTLSSLFLTKASNFHLGRSQGSASRNGTHTCNAS